MKRFILNKIAVLLILLFVTLFIGWALSPFLGALFFIFSIVYFAIKLIIDLIKLT